MLAGERMLGAVHLENHERDHAFGRGRAAPARDHRRSMSVALENARLFAETQRLLKETEQRNAELAVINSIQQGMAAQLDFQAIVDLVGDKLREVFDSRRHRHRWRDETRARASPSTLRAWPAAAPPAAAPRPATGRSTRQMRSRRDRGRRATAPSQQALGMIVRRAPTAGVRSSTCRSSVGDRFVGHGRHRELRARGRFRRGRGAAAARRWPRRWAWRSRTRACSPRRSARRASRRRSRTSAATCPPRSTWRR